MLFQHVEMLVVKYIAGISNCEGIAIDWLGRNIYWTDESRKTVSVASLKNSSRQKVLVDSGLTHPRAIVVFPSRREKDIGWVLEFYWNLLFRFGFNTLYRSYYGSSQGGGGM